MLLEAGEAVGLFGRAGLRSWMPPLCGGVGHAAVAADVGNADRQCAALRSRGHVWTRGKAYCEAVRTTSVMSLPLTVIWVLALAETVYLPSGTSAKVKEPSAVVTV